jgi:hypothetical protein
MRQHVGVVHGLINCQPEDVVHFGGIGSDGDRREFGEPAPQHSWRLAKDMTPDTAYGYDLRTEFLAHFPHHRVGLAFARVGAVVAIRVEDYYPMASAGGSGCM